MTLPQGARLGPYEILSPLGAGGMGEVYKARDMRLGRTIAIKILPGAVAGDPDRLELFEREARAIAALSHGNVLAIHDVGTHDGMPYLVTELLEGQTVRARLAGGALPPTKAVELGIQIARGLAAAHEKGIVHRDIKPENLFVTSDGTVKILDFGVSRLTERAQARSEATTAPGTGLGVVRGTVGYMAPEQARGLPCDHRADIFAFGCVLYELLAGHRAFSGTTAADTVAAILSKDPPALESTGRAIPPALQKLVERCLEKEPHDRFSSAHDLALALDAVSRGGQSAGAVPARRRVFGSPGAWIRRHALLVTSTTTAILAAGGLLIWAIGSGPVLSFAPRDWILIADVDNQTGEAVFDRGLTTAFAVSLEQSTHANVFPRSRVAAALRRMGKTDATTLDEALGREICVRENIRALVTAGISKAGQSYSLTARIVDPATGDTVRPYIRTAGRSDDVLEAMGKLAADIRRDLGESLASIQTNNKPLPQVTTSSLEALSLFAEGVGLWSRGKYDQAVELYHAALKADPDFAMALSALGTAYYSHIFNRPADGKAYLERAMQLSDRTTRREAQTIEISYHSGRRNYQKLRSLYEIYLKTYPDDYTTRYNYATALRDNRAYGEALAQYQEVLRIAPGDASALINLATTYAALGKPGDALKAYERAFELQPDWITAGNLNHEYGFTWVRAGDLGRAESVFNKGLATANKPLSTRSLALLDMYRGRYRSAIARLREAILLNRSAKAPLSESRNELFLATALDAVGDAAGSRAAVDRAAAAARQTIGQVWMTTRVGIEYARRRGFDQAERLLARARADSEPTNREHASDVHRLEGEIALARGQGEVAFERLLLADREHPAPPTAESLARAHRLHPDSKEALPAYERLVGMRDGALGWEPQHAWLEGHYWLAALYAQGGHPEKGPPYLDTLLALWREADPDLPMLRRARQLREQLAATAK